MCGPPIMIKFTLAGLMELGFNKDAGLHDDGAAHEVRHRQMRHAATSATKYVCKDGPVFRFDELDELPNEY